MGAGVLPDDDIGFVIMAAMLTKAGVLAAIAAELGIAAAVHFRSAGTLVSTSRLAHGMPKIPQPRHCRFVSFRDSARKTVQRWRCLAPAPNT
jgi:hypothetical protein